MNKKVYVLSYGGQEGSSIIAVYDTLEVAKAHEKALEDLTERYRTWDNEHDVWQGYAWNETAEKERNSFEEKFEALGVTWSFYTGNYVSMQEYEVKHD